jgi:hypothetical protein
LLRAGSDDQREALAREFGFEWKRERTEIAGGGPRIGQPEMGRASEAVRPELQSPVAGNLISIAVQQLDDPSAGRPDWLDATLPLPMEKRKRRIPVKPSLFDPRWIRGILTAALATWTESNEIDLERLVSCTAAGNRWTEIPFLRVLTLSRGAYCWVDKGPAMEPFYQDQAQVLLALKHVVGESRLWVVETEQTPRLDDFVPGAPHLMLSDLGLTEVPDEAPRSTPRLWAAFAARIAEEFGSPSIALVPRPAEAYADSVHAAIRVISWDRPTSVQTVRRVRTRS